MNVVGDIVGAVVGVAGLALAVVGVIVTVPILVIIGIALAIYGAFTSVDQALCDIGDGVACGVF